MAHSAQHAFDLVVFALGQGQVQLVGANLFASSGLHRQRVVVQHHTRQQLLAHLVVQRIGGGQLIQLGHMVLRRTHAVNELAIVTQQQHASGVLVQTPDSLHTLQAGFGRTLAQRGRQQAVDAGPHRGLVRALGASRFVQQDVGLGVELPKGALHFVRHAFGGGDVKILVHQLQAVAGIDFDETLLHQPRANAAGAKALGEEEV